MTNSSHHQGLGRDLPVLVATMNRRQMLRLTAGAASASTRGCGDDGASGDDDSGSVVCPAIPEETAGPYPGDGSNGANALTLSGIVRGDIRSSLGGATGTAEGVPLTIELTVVDEDCAPLAGHAVYLWHCNRDGDYSMYSSAIKDENYLRGVQETDETGKVTFTSIFPAAYSGRWPHIHFEVYPNLAGATDSANKLRTSQLALPKAACDEVFATAGYEASVTNLAQTSLETDNVFSDGATRQLAEVSGDVTAGYTAALVVAIST